MIPQEHAGSIIFNNNRYNLLEFKFAAIALFCLTRPIAIDM